VRDDAAVPEASDARAARDLQRRHSGRRRLVIAGATGLVAAVIAAAFLPWQLAVLLAWDVAAVVVLVRAWAHVWQFPPDDTRAYATVEDNSRTLADLLLLVASSISLVGVAFAFVKANNSPSHEELMIKLVGIVTILLSWVVVHTILAFKYAHAYYREPIGGVNFKSADRQPDPDYRDFAYLAFTVGMTYQVADTDLTQRKLRHLVLGHALLSFVFGAVILATMVNLIANLLNS
jgi:uncharacterized membrane protein